MTATDTLRSRPTPADGPAPGPAGAAPMLRNLLRLQRDAGSLFTDLHHKYGDLVRLPLGPYLTHLNIHPDGIRHVLVDNNANYVRGAMYERFKIFFGEGLLTTDGPTWRASRRRVSPLFHRAAIATMAQDMTEATEVVLDRLHAAALVGKPVDVVPPMMDLALSALGRIVFGTDLLPQSARVAPAMQVSLEAMIFKGTPSQMTPDWMPTRYNRRIRWATGTIDAAVRQIIAEHEHRAEPSERPTLVDLLLAARDPAQESAAIGAQAVEDEMKTVFMAGHETTGVGLSWALRELSLHPEVQERMAAEVEQVLAGRTPQVDDLPELPVVRMVVDETLRLHPPIWLFPRDAVADDSIGGHPIPAGSSVFMVPHVTHRHPGLWPDPDRFDPERFAADAVRDRPRFAYLPFGGGQRQCIGNGMALLQMQLTLAMLVQRYRVLPDADFTPRIRTLVSLRPANGLRVRLARRPR